MTEKYIKFNTTINDIEFKMLRKNDNCWIKVEPTKRVATPSILHIILNDEKHHWDIYDEKGREAHNVYFKGHDCKPSFYLKSGENCFRITCDYDMIHVRPVDKIQPMEIFLKDNCFSPEASCWATAIYYSKRLDKPPFDEM